MTWQSTGPCKGYLYTGVCAHVYGCAISGRVHARGGSHYCIYLKIVCLLKYAHTHTHARTHTHCDTHTYTVRQCEPPGPSGPELPYTSREEVANTKSREIALAGLSKLLCILTPCGTVVGTLRRLEMWLPPHPRWGIPWGPGQTSRGPARVDVRTFVSSIAISQGMNGILVGTRCL